MAKDVARGAPQVSSRTGRRHPSHAERVILAVAAALVFFAAPARADIIWKLDGSKLVCRILSEDSDRVQVEIRRGKIVGKLWIPRKEIFRIERGMTPAEEFQERLARLAADDLDGHRKLLEWARKKRLRREVAALQKKLPRVVLLRRKMDHPRHWCRNCDATGVARCEKCAGKGTVLDPCTRCEGSGSVPCRVCGHRESAELKCKRCAGTGERQRFDPRKGRKVLEKCPDCDGTGVHVCPGCGGERRQPCPTCKGEKGVARTCPVCNGTPEFKCTSCGGTGLTVEPVSAEQLAKEAEERKRKAEEAARAKGAGKEQGPAEKSGTGGSSGPESRPASREGAERNMGKGAVGTPHSRPASAPMSALPLGLPGGRPQH